LDSGNFLLVRLPSLSGNISDRIEISKFLSNAISVEDVFNYRLTIDPLVFTILSEFGTGLGVVSLVTRELALNAKG
jgi:hypothetical protein